MKRIIMFLLILSIIISLSSALLANSLKLNGLGSKSLSMGGAFVGLADDYSAIFWNPAGLVNLKNKYIGLSVIDASSFGSYKLDVYLPGRGNINLIDAETQKHHYISGLVAYFSPISENCVAGFGAYSLSNFGITWDGADFAVISPHATALIDWMSKIEAITLAPTIALKINNQFSIGASININYGMFDVALHSGRWLLPLPDPPYFKDIDLGQYDLSTTGWGYGATVGVYFKPSNIFSFGATLRTASTIKFSGEAGVAGMPELGFSAGKDLNQTSDVETKITWPMWIAAGVAIKPTQNFTLTADIQWTQWSKIDVIKIDYKDKSWQQIMTKKYKDKMLMDWDNTIQIRIGTEYRFDRFAFRGGFYIDPSPAPDITVDVFFPTYDYNVITFGLGYKLEKFQIDLGFEYYIKKERVIAPHSIIVWPPDEFEPGWQFPMPGTYDMRIIAPSLSISYKF